LVREHPEEKEGSSSASALDFKQGASILETVSLAQHQKEFAAQARRVDEWLDNQPDQDYRAVNFAVATPVTPVASDAGDYEMRGSLPYDEDEAADSESSSVSEAMSEGSASVGVAIRREGLDGGVEVELESVGSAVVGETYQVTEVEDSGLQLSTAEVDSTVIEANTAAIAAPEEDESHVQAEKDLNQRDTEGKDNSLEISGHEENYTATASKFSEQLASPAPMLTSQSIHVTTLPGEAFSIPPEDKNHRRSHPCPSYYPRNQSSPQLAHYPNNSPSPKRTTHLSSHLANFTGRPQTATTLYRITVIR
jgi:hypothetical protein